MLTSRRIGVISQALFLFGLLLASVQSSKAQTSYNFVPVTPCRIADTRNPNGSFGGPSLASGGTRSFPIPSSSCGIPSTAAAYSLNVTVVPSGSLGYITMWPTGQAQPLVSTLNSLDGRVKANAAIVPAGTGGAVSVFASDATNVILDINGYFVPTTVSASLAFYPVTPCRVADTRNATGALGGPSLVGGQTRSFPVLSACGIPSTALAYSLNFTAVPQGPLGYLTVWPAGQTPPLVSTLNVPTGTVTANAAIVPAGSGGSIDTYVTDNTNLVIDVNGYFAPPGPGGLSLYTLAPCRVLDSRQNVGAFSGTLNVNVTGSGCSVPGSAQAYVSNATVVPQSPLGYLTLWPEGAAQPLVSTLNAIDGSLTSNMAIVPAANGSVTAYASNSTQLILDASGYFAPATVTGPIGISFTQSAPNSDNAGGSFTIAASVSNDPGNGGVNWSVTCGSAQCGSFTLTHTANGSSTSYTAPSSVPAGGAVTITATAADSSSTQVSVFVAITSSSIQVSFSQTPPTIIPVSTTANLYASVAHDGSNAGVDWTVTCGSGNCGSFNPTHTASGAATVYSAPSSVPAGGNVTITATSTANNGRNAQAAIAINPTALSSGNLSGNVNGTWVAGLTITLTPSNGGSAINSLPTATNGAYSFSNLTGGTYNVTGSAGYSYSPAAITINGNTVQNITATPQIASYSVSGSVSYAGSQTGVTYITVYPCAGCNPIGGTTLSGAPSAGGTPYTIRGLPSSGGGQYVIGVQIDTQGTGSPNASDPAGNSSNFTLSSNLTGVNVSVTNQTPSAPQTPGSPDAFPASGAAFIAFDDPTDSNNNEIATSYKLYYGTDTNASNLTPVTIQAGNQNDLYILGGLTNGTQYYFKMTAVNANGESKPSSITGPVTIGATTGGNTVSGTVTFTGTASGPLYIGVYNNSLGVYFERIPTPPSSPVAYSISGIPSGSYAIFAVLDQNADGTMDPGDVTNFTGFHGPQPIIVNGNVANETIALGAASGPNTVAATTFVATSHNAFSFTSDSYSISVGINDGTKLPVSMTLFSGPNVAVPYDMTVSANNNEYSPVFNNTVSPNVGDAYQFLVTFSDGSTQVLSSTVTAVLNSFPQNLAMITTGAGTPTIPVLSWSAPASPPAALPYTYQVGLYGSNLVNENWGYSGHHDGGGIPSTTTSVLFNVDGSANPSSSLTLGDTYDWYVGIQDANGNTAQYTTTYTPSN